MQFLSSVLKNLQARSDDDVVDRLNYYYTATMIVMFSILVSAKQYVGYPIQCWVPAHFTEAMEQYTENYCWVQNTWFLPLSEQVPDRYEHRDSRQIIYYQWVPFILLLQALMFHVPVGIWRLLNWQSGLDMQNIVEMSSDARAIMDEHARLKTIQIIAHNIKEALDLQQPPPILPKFGPNSPIKSHNPNKPGAPRTIGDYLCACFGFGNGCGCYVSMMYLCIKLLYCANIVLQFYVMNFFLAKNGQLFGIDLLVDLLNGKEWFDSGVFPRVTLCDFEVKVMGNLHRHTVQCVLMINMFNEKIFLFLWFWFVFVIFATVLSIAYWLFAVFPRAQRTKFLMKYLKVLEDRMNDEERTLLKRFIKRFLRQDGTFILRMISTHAGSVIMHEVTVCLWNEWRLEQLGDDFCKDYAGSPFDTVTTTRESSARSTAPKRFSFHDVDNRNSELSSFKEQIYSSLDRPNSVAGASNRPPMTRQSTLRTSTPPAPFKDLGSKGAARRTNRMFTGDRDLKKFGVIPGKHPQKEMKLQLKSMFKSHKYDHHNPDGFDT